jgi:threonine/homoserine/homoserine lactone efflux protein
MNGILAFLVGIGVALASSVPVGPITFAIFQTTFSQSKRAAMMIGAGGMMADVLYAFAALALFGELTSGGDAILFEILHLLTIPVLIVFGIAMIRKRNNDPSTTAKMPAGSGILLGLSLGISNPLLLAYWLFVASTVVGEGWVKANFINYLAFSIGVAIGVSAFFIGFIYLIAATTHRMSKHFRKLFSLLVGVGFIAFGLYLTVRYVIGLM